tara:strand:- start:913 stop:1476 length:564 start_codon:yes stop_codon:yes gene_type:complete
MRVLVGCETSGEVRNAFVRQGHEAWSCDLLPADDEGDGHIVGDVVDVVERGGWECIILHPPCTALCVSGNRHYGKGKPKHDDRLDAIRWTMDLWIAAKQHAPRVAMENPVGVLPMKATQYVQPWQFGHGEQKKTGLWLHGLPKLVPTSVVEGREQRIANLPPSDDRWKIRSKTFRGIAEAMAEQWGK